MTPLARWVLLALPLVVVEAHPYEHACVCLCCVQNGGPNIAEVCDDQRIQDLQSGASLHVVRDILKHCLIPDHKTPYQLVSDAVCRGIWNKLRRHGCSCDNYQLYKLEEPEEQNTSLDMLNQLADEVAAPADGEDQRGWIGRRVDRTILAEENAEAMNVDFKENSMDVDWEVWCTIQCKNGQGGSACNCDIIP